MQKMFAFFLSACYTVWAQNIIIKNVNFGTKMVRPVTNERGNSNAQVCLPVHRR